jgi:hypothetical protein
VAAKTPLNTNNSPVAANTPLNTNNSLVAAKTPLNTNNSPVAANNAKSNSYNIAGKQSNLKKEEAALPHLTVTSGGSRKKSKKYKK